MKTKKFIILSLFLVLLCCIIGAASAADDVSLDAVDASVDDAITVDAAIDDTDDSTIVEETPVETVADDTTTEEMDEEIQTDEISEESADVDSEPTRATNVYVSNWNALRTYSQQSNTNYNIHLNSIITYRSNPIVFANSATIIGTPNNYITGGDSSKILFSSTGSLDITFINVTFKDMSASVLIKLATSGTNKFINCSFDNIHTYATQSSVIWNNGGWMTITGSNFTNCNDSFGVITNHKTYNTVFMDVKNCRFENNYGRYEPGAINNCGVLNVTDSTFINNKAAQWAGAIHTHSNAYSRIVGSNFTNNVAGTNGGALFSYSKLEVINCKFTGNKATNNGGSICGYSYGSTYNISVDSCKFINNNVTSGNGGAIGAINLGYLNIGYSNFTNNSANNGQAIAAVTQTIENGTTGNPILKIFNNIFVNHTGNSDTVVISGNDYEFNYNIFINSTQNTHYTGIGNQYGLTDYPSPSPSPTLLKSMLGSSVLGDWEMHDIIVLGDWEMHDIIYVNESSLNDAMSDDVHGRNWTDAFGTTFGFMIAQMGINNNGIIYLADTTFTQSGSGTGVNCTIIGLNREKTIFDINDFMDYNNQEWNVNEHPITTFINITFKSPNVDLVGDKVFINCTFVGPIIKTNEEIYSMYQGAPENVAHVEGSCIINFTDCEFKDYNIEGSLLEAFRFSQINFNNCTFKDITANSIVNNTGGFTLQDAINFNECTFNNVNVKGVVDVPTGTSLADRVHIEDCIGIEGSTPLTEGDRDFINSTGSRTATVLTAEVDADDNLVITLKDDSGNAVADAEVKYTVNGEESTGITDSEGKINVPVSIIGDVVINVEFAGNDAYNPSEANKTFNVPKVKTTLTVSSMTKYYGSSKKLSVTLKDENGNALAGETVTITINGKNYNAKTNSNGVASFAINNAKGTYKVNVNYAGTNTYETVSKDITVKVVKPIMKAVSTKVKKGKYFQVSIKTYNKKAIKNTVISIKYNKKVYNVKTNTKGIAKLKLTKKGKFTIVSKFKSATTYGKTTLTTKVKVY